MPLETPDQANSASGFQREPSPDEVASMSPAQKSAYWHTKLATLMSKVGTAKDPKTAQPGDLTTADLGELIANARSEADQADKMVQQGTTDATAQQRADTTAANDAAQRTETNRHNVHEEGIAQQNANETAGYHAQSLGIQGLLAGLRASEIANTQKYQQALIDLKGNQAALDQAKLAYEQVRDANAAKLQTLKDQVTSLSSMDNNDVTNQVNQADSRNTSALGFLNSANNNMTELAKLGAGAGQPGMYADAMKGLLSTAPAFSQSMGGGAVPVGQLTDQHKAEITQLVMAGMPFGQAVQQTAARAASVQGATPPQTGYTGPGASPNPSPPPPSGFSVNPSSPSAEQANSTYAGGH